MKTWLILAALIAFVAAPSFGVDATKAILHVTSVRQEDATDYCTTGECSATRFTVKGYIDAKNDPDAVEYVLECVETRVMKPKPHVTATCIRVHAHNDYSVKVWPDAIAVEHDATIEGLELAYKIISEKEVRKQNTK